MSNHHVSNKALNIEPFHVVSLITRAMELEKQGKKNSKFGCWGT